MQLLTDEQHEASAASPAPARTSTLQHRSGQPGLISAALLVGLAGVGGAGGLVLGSQEPAHYRTTVAVEVQQVLAFDPWEANLQTARFSQAILRPDLQELASESVGLGRGDISEVSATHGDDSPIVQVSLDTQDPAGAEPFVDALIDVTLRDLVASEQVPQQMVVDEIQPQIDAIDATMVGLWQEADVAPGTNLTDAYNQARFDVTSATAEQQIATEQWRIDQLPGIIAAAQQKIDDIEPLLDRWYEASTARSDLQSKIEPASARLQELGLGLDIAAGGTHLSAASVSELPRSKSVLRWAAAGMALGIAVALGLLALKALVDSRRRR